MVGAGRGGAGRGGARPGGGGAGAGPRAYHAVFLAHHVLRHFEGAQVLVHVLQLRVVRGILIPVQQLGDGRVVIVDHTAVLHVLVVTWGQTGCRVGEQTGPEGMPRLGRGVPPGQTTDHGSSQSLTEAAAEKHGDRSAEATL